MARKFVGVSSREITQAVYTFTAADNGVVLEGNFATQQVFTVPANVLPIGAVLQICQIGAGQITLAAASGVTFRSPLGVFTKAQYSTVIIRQRKLNEWVISEDSSSTQLYGSLYADFTAGVPSWLTFSRSTNAMMVDSTGFLTFPPNNVLTSSEDLTNAVWNRTAIGAALTTGFNNAPATILTPDTTASIHRIYQSIGSRAIGIPVFISGQVKGNGVRYVYINGTASFGGSITVDTTNGTFTQSGAITNVSLTALSNGWYSFSFKGAYLITSPQLFFSASNTSAVGDATYAENGTNSFLISQPQVDEVTYQTAPRAYLASTSAGAAYTARIDTTYGLLMERAVYNYALNSISFTAPGGGPTVAAYTVDQIGPDGATTGARLNNAPSRVFRDGIGNGASNGTYTFGVYAKTSTGTLPINMAMKNASSDVAVGSTNVTLTTSWQRITVSGAPTGTAGARIEFTRQDNAAFAAGNLIFAYADYTAGSYLTSTIPCGTTAAFRGGDVLAFSGMALSYIQGSTFSAVVETYNIKYAGTGRILGGPSSNALLYENAVDRVSYFDTGGFAATAISSGGTFAGTARTCASFVLGAGTAIGMGGSALSRTTDNISFSGGAWLGCGGALTFQIDGFMSKAAFYNASLVDSALQAKTVAGAALP